MKPLSSKALISLCIPDLDLSSKKFTGKCKFNFTIDPNDDKEDKELEIECEKDGCGGKTNRFKFDNNYKDVFLYGKEVNDFHSLDYNQFFSLHHGAIQELTKKNDEKDEKIRELQDENKSIKNNLASLQNQVNLLMNLLNK